MYFSEECLRIQQHSKRCVSSHSDSFSSHKVRRVVYDQKYGARTVRSSLSPSEMTVLFVDNLRAGVGTSERGVALLGEGPLINCCRRLSVACRYFTFDNIAGTLPMGRMPHTAQGDAINTDGALPVEVGQANVLNRCGEGLPTPTEHGHPHNASSIAFCILSSKHFL